MEPTNIEPNVIIQNITRIVEESRLFNQRVDAVYQEFNEKIAAINNLPWWKRRAAEKQLREEMITAYQALRRT